MTRQRFRAIAAAGGQVDAMVDGRLRRGQALYDPYHVLARYEARCIVVFDSPSTLPVDARDVPGGVDALLSKQTRPGGGQCTTSASIVDLASVYEVA